MPTVVCTSRLHAVGPAKAEQFAGTTLTQLLQNMAETYPRLTAYLLDDQGQIRKHVAIFIDGELMPGQTALTAPLRSESEVYLMQALSGG